MTNARCRAVELLARREHGAVELVEKLIQKGFNRLEAEQAVAVCQQQGLQSDARFAEQLCRTRIQTGYGPYRISQELQAKRIAGEIIEGVLAAEQENWLQYAKAVFIKKFKTASAHSLDARQKQRRFLLYRGFTQDVVARVLNDFVHGT